MFPWALAAFASVRHCLVFIFLERAIFLYKKIAYSRKFVKPWCCAGGRRERVERLGISEPLVSRDERNEYHGITVERAQRILDALHETVTTRVEEPASRTRERELA